MFNLFGTFLDKIYNDKYGPALYIISHLSVNLQLAYIPQVINWNPALACPLPKPLIHQQGSGRFLSKMMTSAQTVLVLYPAKILYLGLWMSYNFLYTNINEQFSRRTKLYSILQNLHLYATTLFLQLISEPVKWWCVATEFCHWTYFSYWIRQLVHGDKKLATKRFS